MKIQHVKDVILFQLSVGRSGQSYDGARLVSRGTAQNAINGGLGSFAQNIE